MPTQNDFLPFAAATGANVLTQSAYAAASATSTGFVAGTASSAAANKTLRQSSLIASVIAQFIVTEVNQPVVDDGTTATILANFIASIQAIAAAYGGNMFKAQNLSGLADYPTARANLGLGTAAVANTGTATGQVPTVDQADARYAKLTGASFTGPVNGTVSTWSGAVTGLSFNTMSSERFKHNILQITGACALDLLDLIEVVRFNSNADDSEHVGVIAEWLAGGPLDFVVQRDKEGRPESVDYQSLFAVAMAGMRELRGQVASLSARMDAIEARG